MSLITVNQGEYLPEIRLLISEYIRWLTAEANAKWHLGYDAQATEAYINNDIQTLDRLLPPKSNFYLAQIDGEFVGCGALKYLDEKRGEIKRMFVQDRMRGKGLGKQILTQLIADGRSLGYEAIVLDSPDFCKQAHLLYAAQGFREIGPYAGAEDPEEIHHRLKFMQLDLP